MLQEVDPLNLGQAAAWRENKKIKNIFEKTIGITIFLYLCTHN